jgi:hypothetical protein
MMQLKTLYLTGFQGAGHFLGTWNETCFGNEQRFERNFYDKRQRNGSKNTFYFSQFAGKLRRLPATGRKHILSWYPRINKLRERKSIRYRDVAFVQKRQTGTIENTSVTNEQD